MMTIAHNIEFMIFVHYRLINQIIFVITLNFSTLSNLNSIKFV